MITVAFAFLSVCIADTIHVPGEYPSIQAGIEAATNGDTVLVEAGTYYENVNFIGKAIIVRSADGPECTVIDGCKQDATVAFENGEIRDSVLDGFTVTNGFNSFTSGGLICFDSSPTIINNIITGNSDSHYAGIACRESFALIANNTISNNHATGYGYASAGGIGAEDSNVLILDNVIVGNSAEYNGGGIYCNGGSPVIEGNIITDNWVAGSNYTPSGAGISFYGCDGLIKNNLIAMNTAYGNGGGIYCHYKKPKIYENEIRDNYAEYGGGVHCAPSTITEFVDNVIIDNLANVEGGGIWVEHNWEVTLINNNIARNEARKYGGGIYCNKSEMTLVNNTIMENLGAERGGGFYCYRYSVVLAVNTIFWNNYSTSGHEIWVGNINVPADFSLRYSNVQGGLAEVHVSPNCSCYFGPGMLDADPLVLNADDMDFHLTYDSPCRDAGSNEATGLPLEDIEGDPRTAQGKADMGADEFHTHLYCTGDFTPNGEIKAKITGLPGTAPIALFMGLAELIPTMNTAWGDFLIAPPWFLIGPLGSIPSNGLLVLSTTVPATPSAPYDVYLQGLVGLDYDSLTNLFLLEIR